jgi:hypothetical protein
MSKLIALLHFLLAMSGCSLDGTTWTHHLQSGQASLDSKARVQDGVARFECLGSSSGACHYTLYPDACNGLADCHLAPLRQFTVARGDSRQVAGLRDFRPCVGIDDTPLGPDCQPLASAR